MHLYNYKQAVEDISQSTDTITSSNAASPTNESPESGQLTEANHVDNQFHDNSGDGGGQLFVDPTPPESAQSKEDQAELDKHAHALLDSACDVKKEPAEPKNEQEANEQGFKVYSKRLLKGLFTYSHFWLSFLLLFCICKVTF